MIKSKINEPEALNGVAAFHDLFGMPVLEQPTIPSKERCKLRISLLEEELEELKDAIEDNDIIEIADALADLQYVLSGAILEFGLGGKFKALFDEVQRSNMSKACSTIEEAEATRQYYKKERDTESVIKPKEGQFLVYREGDGKVLKSVNYSPADLASIVED
jgi:predicted HAD superfamily Cof-like phosphohydrolase